MVVILVIIEFVSYLVTIEMEEKMSIYENIKEIAKEQKITIKELTKLAGIGENSIYRWQDENYRPSYNSLKKVADALKVDVEDLTDSSQETPQFREIQRHAKKLTPYDQDRLLQLMKITFEDINDKNNNS